MEQRLIRVNNQDLTISASQLPQIWKDYPVTVATTELEASATPKLHELAKYVGADLVVVLIKAELKRFIDFVGCEWSRESIDTIIEQIKSSYCHLTMAQWKLFFAKAKAGKLAQEGQRDGQIMIARITPIIFMQWLSTHAAKCEEANELHYANEQYKRTPPAPTNVEYVPTERIKDAFSRFADEWEQNIRNQSAAQNEQDKRQREAQKEMLLRQYCLKHELDFDLMKAELQNHAA